MSLGLKFSSAGERVILPEGYYKMRLMHIEPAERRAYQSEEMEKIIRFQFELLEDVEGVNDPRGAYLVRDVTPKVCTGKMESGLVKLSRELSFPKAWDVKALCAELATLERYIQGLVGNIYEVKVTPNEKRTWNKLVSFKPIKKAAEVKAEETKSGFEELPDVEEDPFGIGEII